MGNPLKIKETVGGTFLGLQEMQTTEMDYAVHQILTEFSTSLTGAGTINVNGDGTSMGVFTDTTRSGSVGDHPVASDGFNSSTFTLKQNLESIAETSMINPLFLNDSGYAAEHSNNLNSTLISRALSNLVSNGLGSYILSESNPNSTLYSDSGSSIVDTNKAGTTTLKLWRKNKGVSAPSTVRTSQIHNNSSIQEMSDADIKTLAARLRNQIIATGIGQYKFASSNPAGSGETWIQVGSTLTDTRNTVAQQQYAASYEGVFNKEYVGLYEGTYNKQYSTLYEGAFNKAYEATYLGVYVHQFTKEYIGEYGHIYVGNYNKEYEGTFVKQYEGAFVGTYTGIYVKQYQGQYEGNYLKSYTGQYSHQFEGSFDKQYEGTFEGYYEDTYTDVFSGIYTKTYLGQYTGTFIGQYTNCLLYTSPSPRDQA